MCRWGKESGGELAHLLEKRNVIVDTEAYFKAFQTLFEKGIEQVDWTKAQGIMETILKKHFVFDPQQFPEQVIKMYEKDTCFFVTAKDTKTGNIIRFITFLMRTTYPAGEVKVMSFAVDITYQKRGIGKLLMSSIFGIFLEVKRIFLCTRVTNDVALNAYRSSGFVKDENPILDHAFNLNHWFFMEYKPEQSSTLQQLVQQQLTMVK